MSQDQRGFTLIELLAAVVFVVVLLVLSLFLLRPDDYTTAEQNAKRRTEIAMIAQAIRRYEAQTGQTLSAVPEKITAISSEKDQYDLCKYLVPKYLNDLPSDPLVGIKVDSDGNLATKSCAEGTRYASGYAISRGKDGRITISSPAAASATGEIIEVTIPNK